MSDAALIVEDFLSRWLRRTEQGREYVAALGIDGAMDALIELLNAGLIKLQGDGTRITGIMPCSPPDPPTERMVRPPRRAGTSW